MFRCYLSHLTKYINFWKSVIIRPKEKKSRCWTIQPGIIVTFLFFPFFTSFWSPLSIAKWIYFLENRTVRIVGALPSVLTLELYSTQLFPVPSTTSFPPSTSRVIPKSSLVMSRPDTKTTGLPQKILQTLLKVSKIYAYLCSLISQISPACALHSTRIEESMTP